MIEQEKRSTLAKLVFWLVLGTLVASAAYSILRLAAAPALPPQGAAHAKLKSDYTLMLVECILGIIVIFIPSMIERAWHIAVPNLMYVGYAVFLYAAIYLGEIQSFYYKVSYWDTVLHCFSAFMLGSLGFSIVSILNDLEKVRIRMSSPFVALFAFCFALSLGVLWEFYEYGFDGLLGLNMQKFATDAGTPLVGRAALQDTMEDLVIDAAGACAASVIGYLSLKRKSSWLASVTLKVERED